MNDIGTTRDDAWLVRRQAGPSATRRVAVIDPLQPWPRLQPRLQRELPERRRYQRRNRQTFLLVDTRRRHDRRRRIDLFA